MSAPTTIYGIDLGTTYSCIAYVDEYGKANTIPNAEGERTTPSVVFFDGAQRIVGNEAKNNAVLHPDQIAQLVKREMGKSDWVFAYDGVEYSAEEISSYILRKLAGDAEIAGHTVTDVVITCPAYFGINEREATVKAGQLAGLMVRSIINEPTTAAIAYGLHTNDDQVVLVYDLGGGTFDITMIEIRAGLINVIATGGDHFLGGRNWDEVIVQYLAHQWSELTASAEDPIGDPETLQDLFGKAEAGKKALSSREKTDIAVTHAGKREKVSLTREKFNELTAALLERTIAHTHNMLKEAAKKAYTRFDKILLVGGSTRMPQVAERLRAEFNIEAQLFEPDESVAKGAALYGQKLAIGDAIKIKLETWGETSGAAAAPAVVEKARQAVADELGLTLPSVQRYDSLTITNVTSHSFGVVSLDQHHQEGVSNLIRINDAVPAQVTQRFGSAEDSQENVEIRIMENNISEERVELNLCTEIGQAVLDLPPHLPAGSPIEITFHLNEQGRLHATAKELSANRTIHVEIETSRVISQEKFAEAKTRSKHLVVA